MQPKLFTLANGLKVVLEENHTAPVVALNALVHVGSADETEAQAGVSHVIEHMLFKGTGRRKVGEIAQHVAAAGGDINAYTSFDQTVYYINMAKRFVDEGLDILADAVQNPAFDANELALEQQVILEEIRRERDNPSRYVGEILFQKAFQKHTYGRPIIGFEKTVSGFTRADLLNFYQHWYVPQNTTFIAVGDFQTERMLKKIENLFAGFQGNGAAPQQLRPQEPPHTGAQFVVEPDNIQSAYFGLGFPIPAITHEQVPAIDILSHILGGASSSRLEQNLKEKKHLVHSIYSYAYTPKDPGLLLIGGHLNTNKTGEALAALQTEIEKLKNEGPTKEELARAKLNIRSAEVFEKETVGGVGGKLAYFLATAGRLDFEENYYRQIQHVTCEAVAEITRDLLDSNKLTMAMVVPQAEFNKKLEKTAETALLGKKSANRSPVARKKSENNEAQKFILPGGLRVILHEKPNLPLVAIQASFLGGLLAENKTNNGIYHLMGQTIVKGTRKKSALEVAKSVEKIAGHLDGFSGKNSFGLRADFLSEYLEEGLELFREVLLEPSFDEAEVIKEKKLTLTAIKNQEDNLSALAFYHFQKTLFPNHPYGLRAMGTNTSVPRLNATHLRNWHKKIATSKNMVLSIVGDFNPEMVLRWLNEAFAKLPKSALPFRLPKTDPKPRTASRVEIHKEKQQAHLVFGFQGPTLNSPDLPAMTVLQNILAGMDGRLFTELRDKQSLAYSVTAVLQEGFHPGYFAIYMGTEPRKVPKALDGIKKLLGEITEALVGEKELERIKNYLLGTHELDLQKNSSLAQWYGFDELYGLGYDELKRYPEKILKVTREDVLRVAKKYIEIDRAVLALITP